MISNIWVPEPKSVLRALRLFSFLQFSLFFWLILKKYSFQIQDNILSIIKKWNSWEVWSFRFLTFRFRPVHRVFVNCNVIIKTTTGLDCVLLSLSVYYSIRCNAAIKSDALGKCMFFMVIVVTYFNRTIILAVLSEYVHGVAPATVSCRRRRQQHRQEVPSRTGWGAALSRHFPRVHLATPRARSQHNRFRHSVPRPAYRATSPSDPFLSSCSPTPGGDISILNAQDGYFSIYYFLSYRKIRIK